MAGAPAAGRPDLPASDGGAGRVDCSPNDIRAVPGHGSATVPIPETRDDDGIIHSSAGLAR